MGNPRAEKPSEVATEASRARLILCFEDSDDSPTKRLLLANASRWQIQYLNATGKRPWEELYAIREDPTCMTDLAGDERYEHVVSVLRNQLEQLLMEQGDPRMEVGNEGFESYPRFDSMRHIASAS